jgi:hypothetical protein
MTEKLETIKLPEGMFSSQVLHFDSSDDILLRRIYKNWRNLSDELRTLKGRGINLPEALSEGAFCRAMGTVRITNGISGANTSFDAYNLKTHKRIQVKACSVLPDLTSFGPDSIWDELYFVDFYREGKWDGSIDIYLIPNDLIYNFKVNANQTMKQQQLEKRRPRFSIYSGVIEKKKLKPIMTYII